MTTGIRRSPVLLVGILIGLALGATELATGEPNSRAALSTAIPIAYAVLVTVVGRRSETVSVLAGRPVDERWEHVNLEASAWALGATAIVVLVAFAVTEVTQGDWTPYAFTGAVIAANNIGALAIIRIKG
ncbi:MAG: hypothetical protein HYX54_08440 [Chloroflexi bacterium]|nr:hypothetical protein [Chloroflexota bacterium]